MHTLTAIIHNTITFSSSAHQQAALGVGTEAQGNLRNVVNCRVDDGPAFVLGSLRAGVCEDLSLDLVFEAGKKVTFFASGPGDVHLTGYYVTHFVEGENGTEVAADEDNEVVQDGDDDEGGVHVETRREPARKRVKYNDPLDLGEIIEDSSSSDEGEEEEEDEEEDPDHPMKPKSLLAALVDEEPLEDDDESVDGNFELGDTAAEDAADAADLRAMEDECHTKLKLPADTQAAAGTDESSTEASTEGSPKKVHFSPEPEVRAEGDEEGSAEGSVDTEEAREEEAEEHQRKAAMLEARQATPYARKESLTQRNKDVVRGLKRFTAEKESEVDSQTAEVKSQKKQQQQEQKRKAQQNEKKQKQQKPGQSDKEAPVSVRDTKEGLHIEELVVGTGSTPKPGRPVFVRYRGMLDSGKVFDRSGKKPFRFVFGAGQVIRGWDLGLADMRVGGKRRLRIPPALAYGKEASGPIPANSTLTFEVELVRTM